jgi:hypothetical protein
MRAIRSFGQFALEFPAASLAEEAGGRRQNF